GIAFQYVSRTKQENVITYTEIDKSVMQHYTLIVNTSPVGMYPNVDAAPEIPYEYIDKQHLLYDLVYNPVETRFLYEGKIRGAQIKNGLEMLHLQAERSWQIWNDIAQ
ncbi:MAG TPA: shikimate dehydrogenase, partial [Chitinophagales bacterium]|nr:shikimate dehydrogenase [Chitinophagales bacterium]